ncbi:Rare lipoprotein A precursor [Richelia intracellularis HM01]|nr:Rare lipoprotein A precursor [Richelia intracellularis HM01]
MNQRKMWITVTLFAAILGSFSIGCSQIKRGKTTSYRLLATINTVKVEEYKSQGFNSIKNLGQNLIYVSNRLPILMSSISSLKEIDSSQVVKEIAMNKSERFLIVHHTGTRRNLSKAYRFRAKNHIFKGVASFYGYDGSGNKTASGEKFNPEAMTAAHRTLPFGTRVRVTNPHNGRSVIVRINDRGPFIQGRVIDLSYGAARVLGIIRRGIAPVKVQIMDK